MIERRFLRLSLALALVASLHAAIYQPIVSSHVGSDSPTYIAAAHAILGGSYSTPLEAGFFYEVRKDATVDITGLEIERGLWQARERQIFRPPGYPLFLAALGGGDAGASRSLVLVAQTLLVGLATFLLALLVRRWWGSGTALLAATLYALDPWSKRFATILLSEAVAAVLAVAAAYAFTRAWQERAARWWAGAGLLASALTLVRVAFVPAVVLVLVAAALRPPRIAPAAAAGAAALVLLAPWIGWTASVSGRPVLAAYGEGFNLLLAAYGEGFDRTQAEVLDDPAFRRDEANAQGLAPPQQEFADDPTAHPRYLVAADEMMRDDALDSYGEGVRHEPLEVAWDVIYRAYFLWNAHEDWFQPSGAPLFLLRVIDWIAIALALAGAFLSLRRGGPAAAVAIFLLVYTLAIAIHHVEARFGIPVRGLFLAYAAYALARLRPLVATSASRLR
jgi:4-amino-4-deoxy-L-arabinose transferase-like glycosyltransferase